MNTPVGVRGVGWEVDAIKGIKPGVSPPRFEYYICWAIMSLDIVGRYGLKIELTETEGPWPPSQNQCPIPKEVREDVQIIIWILPNGGDIKKGTSCTSAPVRKPNRTWCLTIVW